MKFINLLIPALAASIVSTGLWADEAVVTSPVSDTQKKAIEKIVHDYLVSNPEVLLEASQVLQQKQQQNIQQQAQSAILENIEQLFQGKWTTLGNPKGKVTLVEFFDYQCIHCKKMSPIINNLLKKDKDLRVIYKEFPIFGKDSELASKAAIAAAMQGKYLAMHEALFKIEKHLDQKTVMDAAQSAGLNMNKLKTDMDGKEVAAILDANRQLAEKLHLMGTPAFIIAATPAGQWKEGGKPSFIPGAASEASLQDLIKKAAAGN